MKEENKDTQYSEPYRHFDTLIWQVPAWSFALFSGVLIGINSMQEETIKKFWGEDDLSGFFIAVIGIALLIQISLSYALCRFRKHQFGIKNDGKWILGAQVWLQFSVNLQLSFLLLLLCKRIFAVHSGSNILFLLLCFVCSFFVSVFQENSLLKKITWRDKT